jgi:hypothetical protein
MKKKEKIGKLKNKSKFEKKKKKKRKKENVSKKKIGGKNHCELLL